MRKMRFAFAALLAVAAAFSATGAQYRVAVDGRPVEVLDIPAPSMHDWQLPDDAVLPYWAALFDAQGKVVVRVESDADLSGVRILPLSSGIRPRKVGANAVEFRAAPPFTLAVEPGSRHGSLVVSARRPDPSPPRIDDPMVKWMGPGRRRFDRPIELRSGETLYLAPGAFVEAAVHGVGTNITVCGHGVLSGLCWPRCGGPAGHMLHFEGANVALRDFTVVGSYHWTVVLNNVQGAMIERVNILNGHVLNDDGIDICRSRDVTIRGCFIRSQDDCIAVKYWCEGLKVEKCSLWADVANIFRVGYECDGPPCRFADILIRGVDVLHQAVSNSRRWQNAVNIQASNDAVFANLVFDGLRFDVVKADDRLAAVRTIVVNDKWQQHKNAGHVRGVTFRNVMLPGDVPPGADGVIFLQNHDAGHVVDDVMNECTDSRIRVERAPNSF